MSIALDLTTTRVAEEKLKKLNETLEQKVAERTSVAEARALQLQQPPWSFPKPRIGSESK